MFVICAFMMHEATMVFGHGRILTVFSIFTVNKQQLMLQSADRQVSDQTAELGKKCQMGQIQ